MARRVPVGVVGVISPFNVPTILGIRAVAPALALGNAVLLKPDPRTAVSGGALFAALFEEAGLPAGLLHVLPGGADVGEALVTEPLVRVVSFTGSTRAGRAVATLAGAAPQAGAPGARRQLGAARARRRGSGRGVVGGGVGFVRAPGAGLHDGRAAPGPVRRRRRVRRGAAGAGVPAAGRRPG